jgi:parallel beta-helix repeat protein
MGEMIRRSLAGILLMLLLISLSVFVWHITPVKAEPTTWIVDDDGPADFRTIQEAINAASDGDIIFVRNGTYYENLAVNKTVSLIGEDTTTTILDGGGDYNKDLVTINAKNSYISNFTITSGHMGIYMAASAGRVFGNHIEDVWYGIWVDGVSNCILMNNIEGWSFQCVTLISYNNTVYGNNITGNGAWYGVLLPGWGNFANLPGNNVSDNKIRDCQYGIFLDDQGTTGLDENNVFESNEIVGNDCGLYVTGSTSNTMASNTVTANRIGIILSGATGGHYFYGPSTENFLLGNNITDNQGGILIEGCWDNAVVGNNIKGNVYGIDLSWLNNGYGIEWPDYKYSHDNAIVENNVTENQHGIVLENSSNNTIYHNTFMNNTVPANVTYGYANTWDEGYPSGGNYWSDYVGVDANGDGIGDSPYVIDENNIDHYPLMKTWTPNSPVVSANVDICPQALNLGSKGKWITVYIELPEGYNVADISASSILLNNTIPAEPKPIALGDYDSDGIPDLMVKFNRTEVISFIGDRTGYPRFATVTLTIAGNLNNEIPLQGSDTIKITSITPRCWGFIQWI